MGRGKQESGEKEAAETKPILSLLYTGASGGNWYSVNTVCVWGVDGEPRDSKDPARNKSDVFRLTPLPVVESQGQASTVCTDAGTLHSRAGGQVRA